MQPKKIIYIIGSLRIGGTEKQVVDTAAQLDRSVFEPKVYCLSGGGVLHEDLKRRGIEAKIFNDPLYSASPANRRFGRRTKKLAALWWYLYREQPDIVHCYLYSPAIYGGIAGKLSGKPVMITSRRSLGHFKDGKPGHQVLENMINWVTDKVLVNAEAVKADVLRRERLDARKIAVIYNGVNLRKYRPADELTRRAARYRKRQWGIPETAPVIGMIANLIPYKGHQDFLRAAADVHRSYPAVHFLCIGRDHGIRHRLDHLNRELGIAEQVHFTGECADTTSLYHLLDIQVSASHEEGCSNVLLEGMASGKPIIATAVGGTPEAIVHDETGVLVPPQAPSALAQAMLDLLVRPEYATHLGCQGRKRVERYFSQDQMLRHLETLYLTLLEGRS